MEFKKFQSRDTPLMRSTTVGRRPEEVASNNQSYTCLQGKSNIELEQAHLSLLTLASAAWQLTFEWHSNAQH